MSDIGSIREYHLLPFMHHRMTIATFPTKTLIFQVNRRKDPSSILDDTSVHVNVC